MAARGGREAFRLDLYPDHAEPVTEPGKTRQIM